MNVMSLFDGISCGQVALAQAGHHIDSYFAAEIDKSAMKVTQENFPDTIQLGDVENWMDWDVDWGSIDLLIGGSPCQGFSFAGKQMAFDDPRSKLFFVFLDILNWIRAHNPDMKFLLENVKMKKDHLDVITEHLEVEPVFINSSVVSLYRRPRYYWANWDFGAPAQEEINACDFVDFSLATPKMTDGWHSWWANNREYQLSKSYSCIVTPETKSGCTFTVRQYASWNRNFVEIEDGVFRKLSKPELELGQGLPPGYLDVCSQREAEMAVGNGWTVTVVDHIFAQMFEGMDLI